MKIFGCRMLGPGLQARFIRGSLRGPRRRIGASVAAPRRTTCTSVTSTVLVASLIIAAALPLTRPVAAAMAGRGTGHCAAKEKAVQLLGDDSQIDPGGLVVLLATALQTCDARDSDVFLALGSVLYDTGDASSALRCWRAAWRLAPLSISLANNVAAVLIDIGRPQQAIDQLRVLQHRLLRAHGHTQHADTWKTDMNLASAYAEVDNLRSSARCLERALAHQALTNWHPQRPVASANLIYTRRRLCEWQRFDEDGEASAVLMRQQMAGDFDSIAGGVLPVDPFMALTFLGRGSSSSGNVGPEEVLGATVKYAKWWHVPRSSLLHPVGAPVMWGEVFGAGRGRVAVGYVCSEFGKSHSVMLLMRAVFSLHNRAAFHVVCVSSRPLPVSDHERPRQSGPLAGAADGCAHVLDLGQGSAGAQARAVNRQRIHVLVDLNGWTAGHAMGVLAFRPAPLVVNYMGFAGSTGTEFVDFAAFDSVAAPPEHRVHFTERLLILPFSYFVTDFLRRDFSAARAGVRQGEKAGTRGQHVMLCNHDQSYKLDPNRFSSWCRVLEGQVAGEGAGSMAKLQLLGQDAAVKASLLTQAPRHLRERIEFVAKVAVRDHIRRLRACHVALDTAPIGAHTTAANYLWARVPVVTLPGAHVMSRVAASLQLALARDARAATGLVKDGCGALAIARSEEDLVAVARSLVRGAGSAAKASSRLAYQGVLECLRAATEPLDPGHPNMGLGGKGSSRNVGEDIARRLPVVFDTRRWVRDWERALALALELTCLPAPGDATIMAGAAGNAVQDFSLLVSQLEAGR